MYSPIGRLISTIVPLVLILMLEDFCIQQTGATFYIETIDKVGDKIDLRLYACDEEYVIPVKFEFEDGTELPAVPEPKEPPDMKCKEVTKKQAKDKIYCTTNFHLVINAGLTDGRDFILTSNTKPPYIRYPPFSMLVGVTILDGEPDYPALASNEKAFEFLSNKCSDTEITANFMHDLCVSQFVKYLSIADFHAIVYPKRLITRQYRLFAKVVDRVTAMYDRDVLGVRQNKVNQNKKSEAEKKIKSAVGFLIQKMVDPCLLKPPAKEDDPLEYYDTENDGSAICSGYCKFLGMGFWVYRIGPTDCVGRRVFGGVCHKGMMSSRCLGVQMDGIQCRTAGQKNHKLLLK